jgi:hypothetical protein
MVSRNLSSQAWLRTTNLSTIDIGFVGIFGGTFAVHQGQQALGILLYALAVVGVLAVALVGSALSAIYTASVYCYAALGEPPQGFDQNLIRGAFVYRIS